MGDDLFKNSKVNRAANPNRDSLAGSLEMPRSAARKHQNMMAARARAFARPHEIEIPVEPERLY
jgi:hypothetical protein